MHGDLKHFWTCMTSFNTDVQLIVSGHLVCLPFQQCAENMPSLKSWTCQIEIFFFFFFKKKHKPLTKGFQRLTTAYGNDCLYHVLGTKDSARDARMNSQKLNQCLKWTCFESVDAVKINSRCVETADRNWFSPCLWPVENKTTAMH